MEKIIVTPGRVWRLLESLGRVTVGKQILAEELTAEELAAIDLTF